MYAHIDTDTVDEFKILRDFHEVAVEEKKKDSKEKMIAKETRRITNEFVDRVLENVRIGCILTRSVEDVTSLKDLINNCCQNSEHLPLVKAGIQRWFTANAHILQLSQIGSIFKESSTVDQVACLSPPKVLFAFGSLLVSDINSTVRGMNSRGGRQSVKAITTRLEYDEYKDIQNSKNKKEDIEEHVLSTALRNALRRTVEPIVDESVREILEPAIRRIESVKRERKATKGGTVKQDEKLIAKRKIMYEAEKSTKNNNSDFLATDLHNIFLRICFRKAKPEVIQHMIHYNYPLSAHCATIVFDGVVELLKSLRVKTLHVQLKRGEQTIFVYNATSKANEGEVVAVTLSLQRNCFYICENGKAETEMKFHLGVFEALSEAVRGFSDAFALGSDNFVQKLEEIIGDSDSIDNSWVKQVEWHSNEKLICPV
ncbi:hypothetical protein Y032_0241g3369 [Ancylostoma ceylanicum]|nr:hypothetical protein Y032_0241g3369 [Ancylostoma ceylanicum]